MTLRQLVLLLTVCLVLFGLIMIGSSSVVDASRDFGDKWYYLKLQSFWVFLGLIGFFIAGRFPHRRLENLATPFFLITIVFLVAVLIPHFGIKLLGARRWLNLGLVSFQPSEVTKLTFALYLSALLTKPVKFLHFLASLGLVGGLIVLEPDLGTTLIVGGMAMAIFFTSQGKLKHLLFLLALSALSIGLLIFISPYRLARFRTFLNYSHDPLGSSYQVRQALLAVGSGGLTGVGLGQSRQKYQFLPEVTTDSIFAIVAEELGLFGAASVILAFLLLTMTGLNIANSAAHKFSSNLAVGITSVVSLQALINISSNIALLPFTGIPLPFISYGGTSLVVLMIGMGILFNIANA